MSDATTSIEPLLAYPEKRGSPRLRIEVRTRVSVQSNNGVTTICHGTGTDLSDNGMAIDLPLELKVGKKIGVVILLDGLTQQIRCEGTVRNRRGRCYGIQFNGLSSEDREAILSRSQKQIS